ncbi:hypothetical protein [Chitinophaga filiformis]|uniref:Uncharacterized protein n=1 Tax=Chitinophaga filiformis TaxID=104663 RepID=A0A1G7NTL9_CHIFI|nr:hypothetical protein [Chitinophaga filiformis]SDF77458.1 hypothetical protein SAMN04488121_102939 [Chitinophaga filiformis]
MTFKKHAHTLITLSLIIVLPCCYSPKIFLSEEEKEFADSLATAYSADISLQHDYNAVKENKKNGQFWIEVKNPQHEDLCSKDSTSLKAISKGIATQVFKIMKYKQNYNSIEIVFVESEFPDKQTESVICRKITQVSTSNFNTVQVTYWH